MLGVVSMKALIGAALAVILSSATHAAEEPILQWQCGKTRVTATPIKMTDEPWLHGGAMEYEITGVEKVNNRFRLIWEKGLYLNGKLCWPLIPVVCLRPDGTAEPCSDRQAPLPQPRPADAPMSVEIPKTTIYDHPGGDFNYLVAHWKTLAGSGNDIEFRGRCVSGCTLATIYVPQHRLCFGENASLEFHAAGYAGRPNMEVTKWIVSHYPQEIRSWLRDRGAPDKMTVEEFWSLSAEELWAMGYRKCDPEPPVPDEPPVPMTIRSIAPAVRR
jgi:hypothetical protein